MLVLLALLTAAYGVVVVRVCQARGRVRRLDRELLTGTVSGEDLPPPSAVGWPPSGEAFTAYVGEGIAALDAYLSEGHNA